MKCHSLVWCGINSTLGKKRHEKELEAILRCTRSSRPAWDMWDCLRKPKWKERKKENENSFNITNHSGKLQQDLYIIKYLLLKFMARQKMKNYFHPLAKRRYRPTYMLIAWISDRLEVINSRATVFAKERKHNTWKQVCTTKENWNKDYRGTGKPWYRLRAERFALCWYRNREFFPPEN